MKQQRTTLEQFHGYVTNREGTYHSDGMVSRGASQLPKAKTAGSQEKKRRELKKRIAVLEAKAIAEGYKTTPELEQARRELLELGNNKGEMVDAMLEISQHKHHEQ